MPATAPRRPVRRRPDLERETDLPVQFMARCVVEDLSRFLGITLPRRCVIRLTAQAVTTYAHSPSFRAKIRRPGERGRDHLYLFLQHWIAAALYRDHPELSDLLPSGYATGEPLPETSAHAARYPTNEARPRFVL